MIGLRRPTQREIDALLGRHEPPFSYAEVGATARPASFDAAAGPYRVLRHEHLLGRGRDSFERACASLFAWRHLEIPWLELHGARTPAARGQVVATLARVFGIWFLSPCRVVYSEGTPGASDEVAFAYGTLAGHPVSGEERFAVRFDPTTQAVTYTISSFSRPAHVLSKLGSGWARRLQDRFAVASAEALARACRPA